MDDYQKILTEQKSKIHPDIRWWTNSFYHFTDVHNAALCRSKAEKDTLLYLLKKKSESAFEQYKNRIILMSQPNCFYYNGIFIRDISYHQNSLIIEFNEPTQRNHYAKGKNVKIKLSVQIFYKDFTGRQLSVDYGEALFDYANLTSCMMNIKTILLHSISL